MQVCVCWFCWNAPKTAGVFQDDTVSVVRCSIVSFKLTASGLTEFESSKAVPVMPCGSRTYLPYATLRNRQWKAGGFVCVLQYAFLIPLKIRKFLKNCVFVVFSAKEVVSGEQMREFELAVLSKRTRELVRSRTAATKSAEIKQLRKAADLLETSSFQESRVSADSSATFAADESDASALCDDHLLAKRNPLDPLTPTGQNQTIQRMDDSPEPHSVGQNLSCSMESHVGSESDDTTENPRFIELQRVPLPTFTSFWRKTLLDNHGGERRYGIGNAVQEEENN